MHVSVATMKEYVKNAHIVEGIFLKRHFEGYKGEDRALDKFEEANLPYEADSSREMMMNYLGNTS